MKVKDAEDIIHCVSYKPGWIIKPVKSRFQDTVKLEITYPAHNSDRDMAVKGHPEMVPGGVRDDTHIYVGDIPEYLDFDAKVRAVFYKLLRVIIDEIETHEAREFLRYKPAIGTHGAYWAPFHPHRQDGIEFYGTPELDRRFGVS
jgi:hypothetical protein